MCNSELNDENSDKSLMMYKSEAFKKMPRYPMFVERVMIEFLSDSGASRSYVRPCDLPCQPSLIDKTNESISASGHTSVERFTVPLNCETEGGRVLNHAFVYSPKCPVSILGRDLLCKLNLMLVLNSSGVRVEEGEGQWCCL